MTRQRLIKGGVAVLLIAAFALMLRPTPIEVEVDEVRRQLVREYVTEEAVTILNNDYLATTPTNATVEAMPWEIGAFVPAGERLVHLDTHPHEREMERTEAAIGQARARITGVDVSKPRPEEIERARLRGLEMADAVAMAERDASAAGADLAEAEREHRRAERLFEEDVISESRRESAQRVLDTAEQRHERAQLAVESARKAMESAELAHVQLRDSIDDNEYLREAYQFEIAALEAQLAVLEQDRRRLDARAPFDGYVLEEYINEGQPLAPGAPLVLFGDPGSIEIEVEVLSEEVVRVEEGAAVELAGRALRGQDAIGEVRRVYPSGFTTTSPLGIEEQRFIVRVAFDNEPLGLRPGTRIDVDIITAESPGALAVPERAIFREGEGWAIFTVRGGRAVLTSVEVGLRGVEWAEILDGLDEGDVIITEPSPDLEDGVRVRPRD